MTLQTIEQAVLGNLHDQYSFRPYRDSVLVVTPQTLSNDIPVELRITEHNGTLEITDDGRVAQELNDIGVNVTKGLAAKRWLQIQQSIGLDPLLSADPWELACSVDPSQAGMAVALLADAAVRGDMLSLLRTGDKPANFVDQIMGEVIRHSGDVKIQTRAHMKVRNGGKREVTFSATDHATVFVQSATKANGQNSAYDHAMGVFSMAEVPKNHRLVIFEGHQNDWKPWHYSNLGDVAHVAFGFEPDAVADKIIRLAA